MSHRFDELALPMADRHYNRRAVGSPQFVPPGRCVVLRSYRALWVTSWPFGEFVRHRWPGWWVNSLFRNESETQASTLIRDAIAATRWRWPDLPPGLVTFVDPRHVRPTYRRGRAIYGYCYHKAGFEQDGETEGGLWAWVLRPDRMPGPQAPNGATWRLFDEPECR